MYTLTHSPELPTNSRQQCLISSMITDSFLQYERVKPRSTIRSLLNQRAAAIQSELEVSQLFRITSLSHQHSRKIIRQKIEHAKITEPSSEVTISI